MPEARPCCYCGLPAWTKDHTIPRALLYMDSDGLGARDQFHIRHEIVSACAECNCALGAKVFPSIQERRRWLKQRLCLKYKKILSMPEWSEEDLATLGSGLQDHIRASLALRNTIRERLAWNEPVSFAVESSKASERSNSTADQAVRCKPTGDAGSAKWIDRHVTRTPETSHIAHAAFGAFDL